jgi:hypothetical protein
VSVQTSLVEWAALRVVSFSGGERVKSEEL